MARGIKRGIEWALARLGVTSVLNRLNRPRTAILTYHNVVPTGERAAGVLSLHTDQVDFARQLDFLLESHDIVPLGRALSNIPVERPQVVITFDDGYRGTMTAGLEEMARRDLPSTVFVPPGLLGEPDGLWWDRVLMDGGHRDLDLRRMCLVTLRGQQEAILAWARESGMRVDSMPEHGWICDDSDVVEAARTRTVSIANHTWSHPNLSALTWEAAFDEVTRAGRWLAERLGGQPDCLAYPYGLGGSLVRRKDVPWSFGLLNDGGPARTWCHRTLPPLEVARINVRRGLSLEGLTLRLLGLKA